MLSVGINNRLRIGQLKAQQQIPKKSAEKIGRVRSLWNRHVNVRARSKVVHSIWMIKTHITIYELIQSYFWISNSTNIGIFLYRLERVTADEGSLAIISNFLKTDDTLTELS